VTILINLLVLTPLPLQKNPSEDECEIPCEGDLLIVRQMLGTNQKPFDETQRENILPYQQQLMFHDHRWGSCANVSGEA